MIPDAVTVVVETRTGEVAEMVLVVGKLVGRLADNGAAGR